MCCCVCYYSYIYPPQRASRKRASKAKDDSAGETSCDEGNIEDDSDDEYVIGEDLTSFRGTSRAHSTRSANQERHHKKSKRYDISLPATTSGLFYSTATSNSHFSARRLIQRGTSARKLTGC